MHSIGFYGTLSFIISLSLAIAYVSLAWKDPRRRRFAVVLAGINCFALALACCGYARNIRSDRECNREHVQRMARFFGTHTAAAQIVRDVLGHPPVLNEGIALSEIRPIWKLDNHYWMRCPLTGEMIWGGEVRSGGLIVSDACYVHVSSSVSKEKLAEINRRLIAAYGWRDVLWLGSYTVTARRSETVGL